MALFNLCPCSSASYPKPLPLSPSPTSSSLPKISSSLLLSSPLHSPSLCSSFSALVIQSHKPKSVRSPSRNIKSTKPTSYNKNEICCAVRDSSSNYGGNRPPRETILLPGCDYEHWLIVMEFPTDPKPSSEEMVDTYVKTLAKVVGSEEEAKKKIYALSTTTYTGFQALISEELSEKCKGLPGVVWVLPDSYFDVPNKDYGGDKFIDGKVIPRPQPRPSERQQAPRKSYSRQRTTEPRRYERRRDGPPPAQRSPTPVQRNPNPEPKQTDMVQSE
ncbi:hypothetical protein KI387_002468, partial [Taxus chinensis]